MTSAVRLASEFESTPSRVFVREELSPHQASTFMTTLSQEPSTSTQLKIPLQAGRVVPELVLSKTGTPRILIVEDNVDLHEGWAIYLRYHGYEVVSAYDGNAGLSEAEFGDPCLVVLDLGLPGISGEQLLERLRKKDADIPVVVVTASSAAESEADDLGADLVLSKPLDPNALVGLIDDMLDHRG